MNRSAKTHDCRSSRTGVEILAQVFIQPGPVPADGEESAGGTVNNRHAGMGLVLRQP